MTPNSKTPRVVSSHLATIAEDVEKTGTSELVREIFSEKDASVFYEKKLPQEYEHGPSQEDPIPKPYRLTNLLALSLLHTTSILPLYLLPALTPAISASLDHSTNPGHLLLTSHLTPLAATLPLITCLLPVIDHTDLALAATLLLILGNLLAATSPTFTVFCAGQWLVGIGAGIGEVVAMTEMADMIPGRRRGLVMGCMASTALLPLCAPVLGPSVFGRGTGDGDWWRWVNVTCGALAFFADILLACTYQPRRPSETSHTEKLQHVDLVGDFLSVSGVAMIMIGLTGAGEWYMTRSPAVLSILGGGIGLLFTFGVWESRRSESPMKSQLMGQGLRQMSSQLVLSFLSGVALCGVLIFWPSLQDLEFGYSPAGVERMHKLPTGLCVVAGGIIGSIASSLLKGGAKVVTVVACVMFTTGNVALAASYSPTTFIPSLSKIPVSLSISLPIPVAELLTLVSLGAILLPTHLLTLSPNPTSSNKTTIPHTLPILALVFGLAAAYPIHTHLIHHLFQSATSTTIIPVAASLGIKAPSEVNALLSMIGMRAWGSLWVFDEVSKKAAWEELVAAGLECWKVSLAGVFWVGAGVGGLGGLVALVRLEGSQDVVGVEDGDRS